MLRTAVFVFLLSWMGSRQSSESNCDTVARSGGLNSVTKKCLETPVMLCTKPGLRCNPGPGGDPGSKFFGGETASSLTEKTRFWYHPAVDRLFTVLAEDNSPSKIRRKG